MEKRWCLARSKFSTPHRRRARIIAQLHKQAHETVEYRDTQRKIVGEIRRKRSKGWLAIAAVSVWAFACVCALVAMIGFAV
jgi:type VI protein secretion system component VasF